jgi:hypothetical protein
MPYTTSFKFSKHILCADNTFVSSLTVIAFNPPKYRTDFMLGCFTDTCIRIYLSTTIYFALFIFSLLKTREYFINRNAILIVVLILHFLDLLSSLT